MARWNAYTGPHAPGYSEQVYLMELYADDNAMTEVLLKSPDGAKGAAITFNIGELPYLSLWKNEAPLKTGYVTGLEPATSYPYPKPVERSAGRVPTLAGGESCHSRVTFWALVSAKEVQQAVDRIMALQKASPEVRETPLREG